MNENLEKLTNEFYDTFRGLPSNAAIVRNNKKEDAFEVTVFKILYEKLLQIPCVKENASELSKYIIAPEQGGDGGIDIFVEKTSGDESFFNVIQVKTSKLDESSVREAFNKMERCINDYCTNPKSIKSISCLDVLSASNLDKTNKKNCDYYVVHLGDLRDFGGRTNNEHVLTEIDLDVLLTNKNDYVEKDEFSIGTAEQYMNYNNNSEQSAIVCSINGYELAELSNRYNSTEIGRNILFGFNLRESLNRKGKKKTETYAAMEKTITEEPEKFWFYNNGITILADTITHKNENNKIILERFSIVNGAQTTSTLGDILQKAKRINDIKTIENLKKVYVIARILKVTDKKIKDAIAISNNTQNPINARDLVSRNIEQIELQKKLLNTEYPHIFVEIRRGESLPNNFVKIISHRITSNENLAQLAYAGFLYEPFTAKDKKSSLFKNDYSQEDVLINDIYSKVFKYDKQNDEFGVLFQKTNYEIDELLFVQELYKRCKKYLKDKTEEMIEVNNENLKANPQNASATSRNIENLTAQSEAISICLFYFMTTYYQLLSQMGNAYKDKSYDYDKYYSSKDYRDEMVKKFSTTVLTLTAKLFVSTAKANRKSSNLGNWVRSANAQTKFLDALSEELATNFQEIDNFRELMDKYKVVENK